jgi:hypothetical protein
VEGAGGGADTTGGGGIDAEGAVGIGMGGGAAGCSLRRGAFFLCQAGGAVVGRSGGGASSPAPVPSGIGGPLAQGPVEGRLEDMLGCFIADRAFTDHSGSNSPPGPYLLLRQSMQPISY